MKSIKPQVDPHKHYVNALDAFEKQCKFMFRANEESKSEFTCTSKNRILTRNFLNLPIDEPYIDLIITSPPYVTSYEYADLHQLTVLWLGFASDYRDLRKGTIGSVYNSIISKSDLQPINEIGKNVYFKLLEVEKDKARSVIRYFSDIRKSVSKIHNIVRPGGLVCFVIGDTKYKGIEIDNAKYLTKCLIDQGFINTEVFKRKIGSKNLTPYRDEKGKFSSDEKSRRVYGHEYVIISLKKLESS